MSDEDRKLFYVVREEILTGATDKGRIGEAEKLFTLKGKRNDGHEVWDCSRLVYR